MGRDIVFMKLICSLGHSKCDGHTEHKLSQRRLTAERLAPRESDCSRMYSKVSSEWLPSYIKATRPVLEIFNMAGYFPDSPRMCAIVYVPRNNSKIAPNCLLQDCDFTWYIHYINKYGRKICTVHVKYSEMITVKKIYMHCT